MPVATAQGKKFTFPEGTTPDQMGDAIDEYFQTNVEGDSDLLAQQPVEQPTTDVFPLPTEEQKAQFAQQAEQQRQQRVESGEIPIHKEPEFKERVRRVEERLSKKEEFAAAKAEEVKDIPEISKHPIFGPITNEEVYKNPWSAFKAAMGSLLTDDEEFAKTLEENIPDAKIGVTQYGNYIIDTPKGRFVANSPGMSQKDLESFAFKFPLQVAAGIPGRLAGVPALFAVGAKEAALEAGFQGIEAGVGGEFDIDQPVEAGVLGMGGQLGGELVSAGIRGAKGQIPAFKREVIEAGEELNVPVLTTDVIPPATLPGALARKTGEAIPFAGTGSLRNAQQEARKGITQTFDDIPAPAPSEIIDSLMQKTSRVKRAAGDRLNKIQQSMNKRGAVPLSNTIASIDQAITRLTKKGIAEADEGVIQQLRTWKENLLDVDQSFGQLRDNRTIIREAADVTDVTGKSQMPSKTKALVKGVESAMTRDLDNFVKRSEDASVFHKYKQADAVYRNEARKLTKSKLKNVLDKGDITPEAVDTLLFSSKPSEVKILYDSLTVPGRNAARASLMRRAIDNATEDIAGVPSINPTKFSKELGKIESSTGVFFKGEQKRILQGYKRLIDATKRAQEHAAAPPTGQNLLIGGAGAAAYAEPMTTFLTGTTAGALARAYESKIVRDVLLRLESVKPGSIAEDKLLRDILPAFNAALIESKDIKAEEKQ